MTRVSMSANIGVSAKQVWDMIGGFNDISKWHPAIEKSEIEGEGKVTLRRLHLVGGGQILERLEQSDDDGNSYTYSILESPLPIANYTATIKVNPNQSGSGCTVEWSSDFEAAGAPENDAVKVVEGIYQAGLDNLRKMFGG